MSDQELGMIISIAYWLVLVPCAAFAVLGGMCRHMDRKDKEDRKDE
jgi:hypothetical protein